jgi:hypothetical protein
VRFLSDKYAAQIETNKTNIAYHSENFHSINLEELPIASKETSTAIEFAMASFGAVK